MTSSKCSFSAATSRGVRFSVSCDSSGAVETLRRASAISMLPVRDAQWRGLQSMPSRASATAPLDRRVLTMPVWEFLTASWSGVRCVESTGEAQFFMRKVAEESSWGVVQRLLLALSAARRASTHGALLRSDA